MHIFICKLCNKEISIKKPPNPYMIKHHKGLCRSCAGKEMRKRNKADPEKHAKFVEKVRKNVVNWHKTLDQSFYDKIGEKMKENNKYLTPEELREKYYGWFERLEPEQQVEMAKKQMTSFVQGQFKPLNPQKYKGNITQIFYRSSWERKFMFFCDTNPGIVEWGSEEVIIGYISPKDNKPHRYYPDFFIKTNDGRKILIEIKPESQTKEPPKRTKVTKSYLKEILTYAVNQAKWKRATEYCKGMGWDFKILTERDLGIKSR